MIKLAEWTTVRGFGSVKYFNISYVVLFLVPLIFDLYQRTEEARQVSSFNIQFPGTLRWLYGASLCYAISIALYQIFCPPEIKRFGNVSDYVKAEFEIPSRAHPDRKVNIVLTHLDHQRDSDIVEKITNELKKISESGGAKRLKLQNALDEYISAHVNDAVQRYLIDKFNRLNAENRLIQLISFWLYVCGTAILVILLIKRSAAILFY